MPLHDHFRPPLNKFRSWEEFHAQWPGEIVRYLLDRLPSGYTAGPGVHMGTRLEVDIATFERDAADWQNSTTAGGTPVMSYIPVKPSYALEFDDADIDEYEVRVYDEEMGRQLVAAIELVSPGNKDRPSHRRAFVAKCLSLLRREVSVIIVDIVTTREGNLFRELCQEIDHPVELPEEAGPYAVACRMAPIGPPRLLQVWEMPIRLGEPLPSMPLWLSDTLALPLDFEESYRETCRVLRIQ